MSGETPELRMRAIKARVVGWNQMPPLPQPRYQGHVVRGGPLFKSLLTELGARAAFALIHENGYVEGSYCPLDQAGMP